MDAHNSLKNDKETGSMKLINNIMAKGAALALLSAAFCIGGAA